MKREEESIKLDFANSQLSKRCCLTILIAGVTMNYIWHNNRNSCMNYICVWAIAIFSRDWTPQIPAGRGDQLDFLRQHIRPGQTSPPQRGSCAVVFFFGPLDFHLDGLALLVLSASFIPSGRVFSWNITIGYNESGICWVQTDTKFGVLVQTLARIF